MATTFSSDVSAVVDSGDVLAIRSYLVERLLQDPSGSWRLLAELGENVSDQVPDLFEDEALAAEVPRAMDARLHFDALIAELRLHFARKTWQAALKAARSVPAAGSGVSRWVSIVFVLGLTALGAVILFGPPFFRYLFANWS